MKSLRILLLASSLQLLAATTPTLAGPSQQRAPSQKIGALLDASGFRYTKHSESIWSVDFKGDHRSPVIVLVFPHDEDVVVEGIIAEHRELANEASSAVAALRHADTITDMTILMDSDQDLVIRSTRPLKSLTGEQFKALVNAIAVATDDAFEAIGGTRPDSSPSTTSTPSPTAFRAPSDATASADFLSGKGTIRYNPNLWKPTKSEVVGRLSFTHAKGDAFAMIIAERIKIPLPQLREIALANMQEAAPDAHLVEERTRVVNGTEVSMMRMDGSSKGITFSYLGYYASGSFGSVQAICYTGSTLLDEFRDDFESFLNGLFLPN